MSRYTFVVDTRDLIRTYLDMNPYANPSHRILTKLAQEVAAIANRFGLEGKYVTDTNVVGQAFKYEVVIEVSDDNRD